MRAFALLAAASVVTSFAACVPDTSAPIVEDVDSAEDQRVAGDTLYVVTRQDFRKCAYPMCSGVYVKAVNKAKTTCFDGSKEAECYIPEIDLSAMELSEQQTSDLQNEAKSGSIMISGHIAPMGNEVVNGDGFGKLVGFKAWRNRDGEPVSGLVHLVESSGITCITAPCPSLHAKKLNSTVVKQVTDLNFTAMDLTEEEESAAATQAFTSSIMLTGTMKSSGGKKTFSATQIFDLVQPELPLCTTDEQCGADAHCDTTECLSPCAPGEICATVCMGACKPGAPVPASTSTCQDHCGTSSEDKSCWCDELCAEYGDCCDDRAAHCE